MSRKTNAVGGRWAARALLLGLVVTPVGALAAPPDWESNFGSPLTLGDDTCVDTGVAFPFTFYGKSYQRVWVNSNGTVGFGTTCDRSYTPALPYNFAAPFVAALWGDLNPPGHGKVYVAVSGTEPRRVLTVTFHEVPFLYKVSTWNTFQVRLFEDTGHIQLGYSGLTPEIATSGRAVLVGANAGDTRTSLTLASKAAVLGLDQTNQCLAPSGSGYTVVSGPCVRDASAPSVRFDPAPPAWVREGSVTVAGVVSDDVGVTEVRLLVDGARVATLPVGADGRVSGTTVLATEGPHTVALEALDASGKVGSAAQQVGFDATAPAVELDPLPALTNQSRVTLTGRVTDAQGVAGAVLVVNGQRLPAELGADGALSATVTLSEGPNSLSVEAQDLAGNTGAALAQPQLDTVPPQLAILSPASGQVFGASDVSIVVAVSDASGITLGAQGAAQQQLPAGSHQVTLSAQLAAEGPSTLTVLAQDAAGNPATLAAVVAVLDLSVPLVALERADGRPLQDGDRFGPKSGGGLALSARVDELTESHLQFSFGPRYDLPPGGGVVPEWWSPLTEGVNVVEVRVVDAVGRSAALSRRVVYDATAPAGSVEAPAAGAVLADDAELAVQATDALTGVASVALSVDGMLDLVAEPGADGLWQAALDTGTLEDGAHTLEATLVDGVGNARTLTQPFVVDNTAPELRLLALADVVRGAVTLAADADDATSGVVEVTLRVNGAAVHTCEGERVTRCEATLDTTALLDGPVVVSVTGRDRAGNVAPAAEQRLVVDNAAPERFLVSPGEGERVTDSLRVAVEVRDADFARVECWVDGISLGASSSRTFSATVALDKTMDGPVQVRCEARDRAGNASVEAATAYLERWRISLVPRSIHVQGWPPASSPRGGLGVLGQSAGLLLAPAAGKLALRLPGGAPVPLAAPPVGAGKGLERLPAVMLTYERAALAASVRAGIAAGVIDPSKPVTVTVMAGERPVGTAPLGVMP